LAEKIFTFSDPSEARHLIGMHDELLQTMRQEFPTLALSSRGQDLFIKGPEEEATILESVLLHLRNLDRDKVYATTQQVRYITKLVRDGKGELVEMMHEDTIALTDKGRPVKPKTLGQKTYVDMIRRHAVTFGIGPAGTGKTYLAVALASYYLKNREVERIILTRPAVEAGEKLGFLPGDLVKDAFGNIFEVAEAKPSRRLDPDRLDYCNMGYRLKLVTKNPQSPIREVHDNVKFVEEGIKFWVFNREEDARAVEEYNPYTITASELVLVRSVLQTKPATPAKAEITRRYPSIEDLQKMSEENDLGNLLDQAYTILKEQASLGERRSNLEADKFKRCIPHFEREGFGILERGTLIEVSW